MTFKKVFPKKTTIFQMLVLKTSKCPNSIVNFCIPKPKAAWWFIKPEITGVISIGVASI